MSLYHREPAAVKKGRIVMYRDMSKAIGEYNRRFANRPDNHNAGTFFCSDVYQIMQMSKKKDPWDMIHNALQAGFMIGYRTAKRQMEQRK